jgi:hypothetical protein
MGNKTSREHVIHLDGAPKCIIIDSPYPGEDYHLDAAYSSDRVNVYTRFDNHHKIGTNYINEISDHLIKIFYKKLCFKDAIKMHTEMLREQCYRNVMDENVVLRYTANIVNENSLLKGQLKQSDKIIQILKDMIVNSSQ